MGVLDRFRPAPIEKTVFTEKIKIVEVEKPRNLAQLDQEGKKSVRTLSGHPGFLYLLEKLKIQRALLEAKLKNDHHADLREVELLQSGIFWSRWLEDQLHKEVYEAIPHRAPVDPTPDELTFLKQVQNDIQLIGAE